MKERTYRNYLLGVLLVTLAFNTKDRLIFGLALQDIKVALALSDTQLGFLSGLAFALFYSLMGLPIARWADRGNRVAIIAISTAVWSVAVALCGVAQTFTQMLLIRVVVAVGEAGTMPPSYSLLADHFTRGERPRAVAILNLGTPLSALIGYFLAGWLMEAYGWRLTFMLLGLPGIALAVLTWWTLREPRCEVNASVRHASTSATAGGSTSQFTVKEVCVTLWRITSLRHLLLGFSVLSLFSNGISQWQLAFFMRSYGMGVAELGAWFAGIYGAFALVGTYLGGVAATRYAYRNERLQLKAAWLAYSSFGVLSCAIYFVSNPYVAIILSGFAAIGIYAANGPLFAAIQSLVPPRMRAISIALLLFLVSLIGAGLGPLAVGVLSDAMRAWAGEESLRYALLALSPGYIWSGWHFLRASKTVLRDLESTAAEVRSNASAHADAQGDEHERWAPVAADRARVLSKVGNSRR